LKRRILQQILGSFEQSNDVLDSAACFVEGVFEFAIRAEGGIGLMMKEAVCKRAAELLVKQDEQQRDFDSFLCQAVGIVFAVVGQLSVSAGSLFREPLPGRGGSWDTGGMFQVEIYGRVRHAVLVE
jgi:hypothetical protein